MLGNQKQEFLDQVLALSGCGASAHGDLLDYGSARLGVDVK